MNYPDCGDLEGLLEKSFTTLPADFALNLGSCVYHKKLGELDDSMRQRLLKRVPSSVFSPLKGHLKAYIEIERVPRLAEGDFSVNVSGLNFASEKIDDVEVVLKHRRTRHHGFSFDQTLYRADPEHAYGCVINDNGFVERAWNLEAVSEGSSSARSAFTVTVPGTPFQFHPSWQVDSAVERLLYEYGVLINGFPFVPKFNHGIKVVVDSEGTIAHAKNFGPSRLLTVDELANSAKNYERLPFSGEFQGLVRKNLAKERQQDDVNYALAHSKIVIARSMQRDYPRHSILAAFSGFDTALKGFLLQYTSIRTPEIAKMSVNDKVELFERAVRRMGYSTVQFDRLKQTLLSAIGSVGEFENTTVHRLRNAIAHGDDVGESVRLFVPHAVQACYEAVSYIMNKGWESKLPQRLFTDVLSAWRSFETGDCISETQINSARSQFETLKRYIHPDELYFIEKNSFLVPWLR